MKQIHLVIMIAACALVAVSCAVTDSTRKKTDTATGASGDRVFTVLTTEKESVPLGKAIRVSLVVRNEGHRNVTVLSSRTAFDSFEIKDPNGAPALYVGGGGQFLVYPTSVAPTATITIADGLDLTDKYLIHKTGRYTIRFKAGRVGLPATTPPFSNTISIDVTQGELSACDRFILQLRSGPKQWDITKSPRGVTEVAPFGRQRVPGFALYLGGSSKLGKDVHVWFTKAETLDDPKQQGSKRSEYLGRTQGFYVYIGLGAKALNFWPNAVQDVSRALEVVKE